MAHIVVYGAGGMGKEVAEAVAAAAADGACSALLGFVDDDPGLVGQEVLGYPVLDRGEWLDHHPEVEIVLGFGHPWRRYATAQQLSARGLRFATIVDPRATVSRSATIGDGTVIFAGCIVSSQAALGGLAYLNYNTLISHDAQVGDFACIMGQAAVSGEVRVGQGAFVGVGVSTRQGVRIGEWAMVGAGAVVVSDIPPLCVALGVPARPTRFYDRPDQMPPF